MMIAQRAVASDFGLLANIRLQLGDQVGPCGLPGGTAVAELASRRRRHVVRGSFREEAGLFSKMGDVLVKLNEPRGARNYYGKAAASARSWYASGPTMAGPARRGRVPGRCRRVKLLRWNDPAAALRSYQGMLWIAENLLKEDPRNTYYKTSASYARYFLGTALERTGDAEDGALRFRKYLTLRKAIATNPEAQAFADRPGGGDGPCGD